MVRMTIRLTDDQLQQLRERAVEQGISVSGLVRQGVDLVLRIGITRERAKAAVGFIEDAPDLSVNHDKYLAEVYAERPSD